MFILHAHVARCSQLYAPSVASFLHLCLSSMAPSKKTGALRGSSSVPSFKRFAKNLLRHCPDSQGHCLWITRNGLQTEHAVLNGKRIAAARTPLNCEALNKMQNWLPEEGSTVATATAYLQEDIGLGFVGHLKDAGADYLAACGFFNKYADGPKDFADAERHVSKYVSFLEKLSDDKKKECRRLALHGARLFLLSCSVLEQAALVQHPEKWHSKVNLKHQHTAAKAFAKGGGSKRLKTWLVEGAQHKFKKWKGRKKVAAADGSSGDGSPTSDFDESSASSASSPSPDAASSHSGSTSENKYAKEKKREKKSGHADKAKRASSKDKGKKAKKSKSADRKKRRRT